MPRGYRCIILAALGWLILAASPAPDNSTKPEQSAPAKSVQHSLDTIARAQDEIAEAAKPGEYEQPCPDGKRNYKSDLCAQWYAANAARDAADWAYWSLAVSILGTIGIGVALGLTIQSNRIAVNTARLQLRCYMSPEKVRVKWYDETFDNDIKILRCSVTMWNRGQTPARNVKVYWTCWLAKSVTECREPPFISAAIDRSFIGPSSPFTAIVGVSMTPDEIASVEVFQRVIICVLNIEYTAFDGAIIKDGPYNYWANATYIDDRKPGFITEAILQRADREKSDPDQGDLDLG
jgi:hypothetical protein